MRSAVVIYTSFITSCVIVILIFITATTYLQLAAAIVIYPLFIYFVYKVIPRTIWTRTVRLPAVIAQISSKSAQKIEENRNPGSVGIADIDKRVFLKLIGATGLSIFLFSLFSKKAENLLFKDVPASGKIILEDTAGKKIDPAQNQPMDGYRISEIDDDVISFYGFTNKNGAWYIMRIDMDNGSFRYIRGERDFPGTWINREDLGYDYFDKVFKL